MARRSSGDGSTASGDTAQGAQRAGVVLSDPIAVSDVSGPSTGASGAFFVALPYPPTLNTLWRRVGNRTLLSEKGRRYHEVVAALVAGVRASLVVPPPPHHVLLIFSLPDRRKRDIDNLPKAVLDPLYRAIGVDDSEITRLELWKYYAGDEPGVDVTIRTATTGSRGEREEETPDA